MLKETVGRIVNVRHSSQETPRIKVEYCVDGTVYRISENVTVRNEPIKIGFLPVGQQKVWTLGPVFEGEELVVIYDSENPANGYLRDNTGKTC